MNVLLQFVIFFVSLGFFFVIYQASKLKMSFSTPSKKNRTEFTNIKAVPIKYYSCFSASAKSFF